jgi:hypothetical protein
MVVTYICMCMWTTAAAADLSVLVVFQVAATLSYIVMFLLLAII